MYPYYKSMHIINLGDSKDKIIDAFLIFTP